MNDIGQTPSADEDCVIWSKAPEQPLNGPRGETVLPNPLFIYWPTDCQF